ncbi:MAG: ABC-F family ATP-binding cassette domain-containing protein [Verrucomicrobia bacterium]|nr:ABC-F family ATP-binding cassette domain-containing protein [Verrucomicrobiota bacterium]
MSTLVTATEITVRYGERTVLDGATLAIDEGDCVGLVGRNGCGKTTFVRILAGLQLPDSGNVTRRRDLVVSYLPQDFMLDAAKSVHENIRDGARHVLDLIVEFESLPAASRRHQEIEHRIAALEGWTLDPRIATAMAHLNCPEGARRIDTLSGGEKRRVAMCRAIVSRPDFLILDEPTNHLDPEAIEWVAEFLDEFKGAFLVVTHDRYFLDRAVKRMVELSDGRFFSHHGNYTDYLLDKAERQAADAVIEHKRQMFLKKELAWVRQGPRAQRSKQKNRFERYYETAAQDGPAVEEDVELCIPPPPPLGNRVVELINLGMELGGRALFRGFNFTFQNGQRVGVAGRNGLDLPTLRVLEEALIAFPGVVLVVSHDRYFLNRICTDVLAFEGDGRVAHSVGDYDYYLEKKQRTSVTATRLSAAITSTNKSAALDRGDATPKPTKPRKLSFKEARELAGMEAQIHAVDLEVARIEGLFASPDFHRTHATQTNRLTADLAAAKEDLARLYARWEELEAIRVASTVPSTTG